MVQQTNYLFENLLVDQQSKKTKQKLVLIFPVAVVQLQVKNWWK
jgi:hypothetical protein